MSSATTLLKRFTDADIDWMLDANEERHVTAGENGIVKGEPVDAIYVVLEGVLAVEGSDSVRRSSRTSGNDGLRAGRGRRRAARSGRRRSGWRRRRRGRPCVSWPWPWR